MVSVLFFILFYQRVVVGIDGQNFENVHGVCKAIGP